MRKVALLILYDRRGRFLLQYRTPEAKVLPEHWAFFGGGLKRKERPQEALWREAQEELNYIPLSPELVLIKTFKEGLRKVKLYIYIEEFKKERGSLVLKEGQNWGWFKPQQIQKLKMTERDKGIIAFISDYLEKNGNRKTKRA